MTDVQKLIVSLDYEGLRSLLTQDPALSNQGIPFDDNNRSVAHPLHRICDAVFNKIITDEQAVGFAKIFLDFGAEINATVTENQDSPLTAAASLHAEQVGMLYVDRGANIHHAGCHGGTALHWAAWVGRDKLVDKLIRAGADIHRKCVDFGNTPLQWARHGFNAASKENQHNQLQCVRLLIAAGAEEIPV
jgi:ankyrin repeat protein